MFKKILVANRGEIAVRIIRTCKEMGIRTVAVYSDTDAPALHVLEADEALNIGPPEPSASYLNIQKIMQAAKETSAEAVHPGYGFLAENPDFAALVESAGLSFIGPPSPVIRNLGDKTKARNIMQAAGVPVIPGTMEATTDTETLCAQAEGMEYPILIKAAAGGGGKGMRTVDDPKDMQEACISAISEAEKAFGNGAVYLEKYLLNPRHIEFQILADQQGHAVHLFERECSIQRRHQKIIEETPSPVLTPLLRESMAKAALSAAAASGYVNAGTVEFLFEPPDRFYFLEVNTRLQVEHPITEMTTGLDLVRHQIKIAAGNPLPFAQADVITRGHAMECRIYAEDPGAQFFPCPGPVLFYQEPQGPGIRVDGGIYQGFQVPVEYDPILSKLIVWAEDRETAINRMIRALQKYPILGIRTTVPFLLDVIQSEPFKNGKTDTGFIPKHFGQWSPGEQGQELAGIAYVADTLTRAAASRNFREPKGIPSPWETLGQWEL
ncbi:MAG: acetyl-CoA carboxylase biotin carboxylase subunit [Deltaproteobacteria bacterium]|nr:acetyl-CoA carboxylase biotin carboxylase subunit [Deltaproteobacteria bacterium]